MTSLQIESGFHPWVGYSQKNWHGWGCAAHFLKPSPYLWSKRLENHILWGRTYLYSPYKDVTPSPRGEVFSLAGFALLLSVISLKISRHSLSTNTKKYSQNQSWLSRTCFSRFPSATCTCFDFWLVHWIVCVLLVQVVVWRELQLKTTPFAPTNRGPMISPCWDPPSSISTPERP